MANMAKMIRTRINARGVAAVEMAVVLPLLLLVTFGLMEYGWLFLKAQQVANAARQGARYAALPSVTTVSQVKLFCKPLLPDPNKYNDANSITVEGDLNTSGDPNGVTVTVTVPYEDVKLFGSFLGKLLDPNGASLVPAQLRSSVTMVKEGP